MEKLGKWFLTDTGKAVCRGLSVVASIGGFAAYMLPQGVFIDKLQSVVQMYYQGLPKPLNPDIEKRAHEVLMKVGLKEKETKLIKFFTSYGLDMYSAGCVQTHWGGIVGIPDTFNYKIRNDVNRASIQFRNTPNIKWSSEAGLQFQESLILSENAQKFAIAKEINISSIARVYAYGLIAGLTISSVSTTNKWANERYNFYTKPRSVRMSLYIIVCSLGITVFVAFKDLLTIYFEHKADIWSAEMGEDYLDGGIEFYQKIIQRNMAMRTLMGKYGESLYTAGGNDVTYIRTPHLPYDTRLDILKDMKKNKIE